ncbi:MAG: IS1 family transposase [Leptolyngbya sp. SIO1E4]|nr:IS1 family transposase [Leptolyngbya sp. SIO1E4]
MSSALPPCPDCGSSNIVKNGKIHTGKQNHKCKECLRQFVEDPQNKIIDEATKHLIDNLLLEKIPLAGIARVAEVSEVWLQQYVNAKYAQVERQVQVRAQKKARLMIECDEAWSFVANKGNKQWIWLAINRDTREIVGVHIGDRSRAGAQAFWDSMPPIYRQCAVCYTDFWEAYERVLPAKRHRAVGKESGQTNHIERFNGTLRQRVSRLVRKTLSFSKKLENHIGAIWSFIHHYNASLPV